MKNKKTARKKSSSVWSYPASSHLLGAIGLFILSIILSRGADMQAWEVSLFKLIYSRPVVLRPFFFIVTQAGSIHMLAILALVLFIWRRYDILFKFLSASLFAYLVAGFAKSIWGRARPFELIDGVTNLDYQVLGPGFPSGHTALVVAMGLVLYTYLPKKYRIVVPIMIIVVGWSRMYLGIHAPLDVVGGFAIGWLSFALVSHLSVSLIPNKALTK